METLEIPAHLSASQKSVLAMHLTFQSTSQYLHRELVCHSEFEMKLVPGSDTLLRLVAVVGAQEKYPLMELQREGWLLRLSPGG